MTMFTKTVRAVEETMARRTVSIRPLQPSELSSAFPLARLLVPALGLPTWQRFAREMTSGGAQADRGILTAEGEGGYLCGLVIYRVIHDLRHGRVLTADHVIAFDMVDRNPVAAAVLAALEDLCTALGCDALHTSLEAPQEGLKAVWENAGHHTEKTLLCKTAAETRDHR